MRYWPVNKGVSQPNYQILKCFWLYTADFMFAFYYTDFTAVGRRMAGMAPWDEGRCPYTDEQAFRMPE